jgi:hypothetical protein
MTDSGTPEPLPERAGADLETLSFFDPLPGGADLYLVECRPT